MLQAGEERQTEFGMTCKIIERLGNGGQGEVYKVSVANKLMALKWYYPDYATSEQQQALDRLIKQGPPNEKFLWPLELVYSKEKNELGYLMPLREDSYKDLVDLMTRRVQTTFSCLAKAGLQLADSYYRLHINGLCYRDISFGNVFINFKNGEVLICDNDNVTVNDDKDGGVLGTQHFMAPEIVRHEAKPSTLTDLYSLSVLLFYLFMSDHPLNGKREADIHVLDAAAMGKIYGHDPLFIFDAQNNSNRPVPGYQDNATIFWPLYPQSLRDLFTRAFTDGLHNPQYGRVTETEWRNEMVNLHDSIFYCPHCASQNFYDAETLRKNGGEPNPCWSCKKNVQLPFRMRINKNVIMLNRDTLLFPHHVDRSRKWDFSKPIAMVNSHPKDPNVWGMKNLSDEKWVLTKTDGSRQDVEPQRSALLAVGSTIHFGDLDGEIKYS